MKRFLNLILIMVFISAGTVKAAVNITKSGGWFESAYVEWTKQEGYSYNVYISTASTNSWKQIDKHLIREYADYGRADVIGIKAGSYKLKVVPVINNSENINYSAETEVLNVVNYDRSGFAHFKTEHFSFNPAEGVGAYKNDGTLKAGAKVFYVTADNVKTITTDVVVNDKNEKRTAVGMQNIIYLYRYGYDNTPIAFRIIGTIKAEDMDDLDSYIGLQIKGRTCSEMNITIEGIGSDATIYGFGFLIRCACSVELRNFAIMEYMEDGVSIDSDNNNIWIHNLDLFYGKQGAPGSDFEKGDGAIDIKADSKYCTISYNHFWDNGKASLCGYMEESGPNYITYHHNWFDHSDSRHPRIRIMSVHVYNNYYDGNSKSGVGVTMGSDAFVENNYFRNCKYPMLISMQGSDINNGIGHETTGHFSMEDGGMIKATGNEMTGQKIFQPWREKGMNNTHFDAYVVADKSEQVPSTIQALQGGHVYNNFDTDASQMYTKYTCHDVGDVVSVVTGDLGAGRCNHGDFSWTFGPNEDSNYNIVQSLSTALQNYRSTLIGFFGKAISNGGGTAAEHTGSSNEGEGVSYNTFYNFTVNEIVPTSPESTIRSDELKTTGGTFVYGNVSKIEPSTIAASGYAYRLDGDAKTGNTKYAQINLDNLLEVGDIIYINGYTTSTPSDAKPYGFTVYADMASTGISTQRFSAKNTEEVLAITVDETLCGLRTLYICRSIGYTVYFTGIEVNDLTTGIKNINSATESRNGRMYNTLGMQIYNPRKGQIYIMNGKKYIGK